MGGPTQRDIWPHTLTTRLRLTLPSTGLLGARTLKLVLGDALRARILGLGIVVGMGTMPLLTLVGTILGMLGMGTGTMRLLLLVLRTAHVRDTVTLITKTLIEGMPLMIRMTDTKTTR